MAWVSSVCQLGSERYHPKGSIYGVSIPPGNSWFQWPSLRKQLASLLLSLLVKAVTGHPYSNGVDTDTTSV